MFATTKKLVLTLAVIGSAVLASPAFAQEEAGAKSADWELKGLRLGASLEQVKAAMPAAECEVKEFDRALAICTDWKNTLGGEPAIVVVKFLDEKAIFIGVENISNDQAQAAANTLIGKFGEATEIQRISGWFLRGSRKHSATEARTVWRDGNNTLMVDPFNWTDAKKRMTWSAVILMNEAKHEREWIVRFNNRGQVLSDL